MKKVICFLCSMMVLLAACKTPPAAAGEESQYSNPFDTAGHDLTQAEQKLVGGWQRGDTAVGASRDAVYVFLPDGTYFYNRNMAIAERLVYQSGTWEYADGVMTMLTDRKVLWEGGDVVKGGPSTITEFDGGQAVEYRLNPPEALCITDDGLNPWAQAPESPECIMIDGELYYKIALPFYYVDEMQRE